MNDLAHIHKEIARLELTGLKPAEIADTLSDLGITTEYLSRVRSNPVYQHFLKRLEDSANKEVKDIRKTLVEKAHDMLEIIIDIAEDTDAANNVRLNAAKDVLDRAGYKPIATEVRLNINDGFSEAERNALRAVHDQMKCTGLILDLDLQGDGRHKEVPTAILGQVEGPAKTYALAQTREEEKEY